MKIQHFDRVVSPKSVFIPLKTTFSFSTPTLYLISDFLGIICFVLQNSETSKEPEKQKEVFTETPERQTKIKKRSKLEKTPNEPSAKKQKTQKSVTRLRSTKKDSDSDLSTSLTENITEENNTNKENQDVNISNCNISTDVLAEKKVALNNHMNNEKVLSLESDGMKKVITCKDLTTRGK